MSVQSLVAARFSPRADPMIARARAPHYITVFKFVAIMRHREVNSKAITAAVRAVARARTRERRRIEARLRRSGALRMAHFARGKMRGAFGVRTVLAAAPVGA